MDINATLIGQFITFSLLVWFTMKYVWPPVIKAIHEREKKIAAGLEAAERSKRELEAAEHKALSIIRDAKLQATHVIEQANLQSAQLVEEAKAHARQENLRIVEMAQGEIDREVMRAKESLKAQVAILAIAGAEKIIQRNIDPAIHHELLNKLAAEI
ncbi:MAG: F0F1 ATP synthase subunit B [Gammaproteobacteria bacterium RIFCSPHIGHO2_12_FULL_43_28]|nr:MAG: F0F1 ATP synthase subunit B [Gammaproteobacteria bacterium RIFCSPHIGHO2_12_FULL_43_28]